MTMSCGLAEGAVWPAQVYDTRADVYSWGVLLAELVAQKPPYDGMYLTPTQVSDSCQRQYRTAIARGELSQPQISCAAP